MGGSQYGFYQAKDVEIEEYSDAGAGDRYQEHDAEQNGSRFFAYCNDAQPEGYPEPNLRGNDVFLASFRSKLSDVGELRSEDDN